MTNTENQPYTTQLHWIVLLRPILLIGIVAGIMIYFPILYPLSAFFLLFLIGYFILIIINYALSSFSITEHEITLRTGFWIRQTINIPLKKIESVDIRQSILGSLMNFGTIILIGTGGSRYMITDIQNPLTCRRLIEQRNLTPYNVT